MIAKTRYTVALKNVDLSNMAYYYGLYDENVGALSEKEINFLKASKARVEGVESNHYNIWKGVIDHFRDGEIKL